MLKEGISAKVICETFGIKERTFYRHIDEKDSYKRLTPDLKEKMDGMVKEGISAKETCETFGI